MSADSDNGALILPNAGLLTTVLVSDAFADSPTPVKLEIIGVFDSNGDQLNAQVDCADFMSEKAIRKH